MQKLNKAESAKTAADESSLFLTVVAEALQAIRTCLTHHFAKVIMENDYLVGTLFESGGGEWAETCRAGLKSGSRRLYTTTWELTTGHRLTRAEEGRKTAIEILETA